MSHDLHKHTHKTPTYSLLFTSNHAPTMSHHNIAVARHTLMRRHAVLPNKHTYPLLLKSLSKSGTESPSLVHTEIVKFGFGSDAFVQNSLVAAYSVAADLCSARKVFDEMSDKDVVSWTAMVRGYAKNGQLVKSLSLFSEMRRGGVPVDEVVVAAVLASAGAAGDVWLGRCMHGFYVECGRVKWDVYVGTALVDMYAKCRCLDDARRAFDEMHCTNVVSWSALIAGYVNCGWFKDALSIFRRMLVEGLVPNQVTLASVLTACAQLGALDQGRWIHSYIDRNRMVLNFVTGTALIDMYAKCGCINDAMTVFRGLPQKNVHSWTALINGLAMHGRAEECMNLFSGMAREKVRPNEVTFVGVLCACSHGGLVDKGRKYFRSMSEDYGIKPRLEHYGCMVDLLGRAGLLEEALHLIETMPMEPSAGVWGALLGACVIHKDFVLGERIGKHLAGVQASHGGRYALLANMYSLSQKWEEAANVRISMKGRRVEKITGCSWLEVDGVIHEFVALDECHPQSKLIYETLRGMITLMKLEGHPSNSHLQFLEMDVR